MIGIRDIEALARLIAARLTYFWSLIKHLLDNY